MDRGRDRRYEHGQDRGAGSYRSSERDDPPKAGYRSHRSPPPRERSPPSYRQPYAAREERRRSRSPQYSSRGGGTYRGRPRSPPARNYSPRRDTRPRSPPPRARRYSRSPVRARSPRRDPSPHERRPRSPAYVKRPTSPRGRYEERRDFSPLRNPRSKHGNEGSFPHSDRERDRDRSPPRRSEHISRVASPISSRRSSPPVHPDRLRRTGSRSPAYRASRAALPREPAYRDRSPPRREQSSIPTSPSKNHPPPRSPRDPVDHRGSNGSTRPNPTYWNEGNRPPPRGPSHNSYGRESPSGPPSAPVHMSIHNRPGSNPILSAPTRPRGGGHLSRTDSSRDQGFTGPSPRGSRPPPSPYETHHPRESRPPPSEYPPPGPRSGYGGPSSYDTTPRHGPPFRTNNSTSTTYPRTQRFNTTTNHLASLPSVIPGGKALPSMDPAADKKASQLEEEAAKLREQIAEKQREKRAGLREWESRERESRRDGLRSDLAEQQLQGLSGEVIGGQAF